MRKGFTLVLTAALALLCARAHAYELVGLPGFTWGNATYDAEGVQGAGSMGFIHQGIDWAEYRGIMLDTYAEYRWMVRSRETAFYNSQGPALGVELRNPNFRFGIDYYWQRFSEPAETSNDRELYLEWYYGWDLGKYLSSSRFIGLPGSTWGRLNYDVSGLNGSGFMGYVNQGIDWARLPGDVIFNTFAEFRWRGREKNTEFYDASGPAVGVEFRKWFLRAGADYYSERFPGLKQTIDHMEYYLTWYYAWDLMKLKQ